MRSEAGPSEGFRLFQNGAFAELEFSAPPANVLDIALLTSLARALSGLSGAPRALVVSGKPHFCAGVDIADHAPERTAAMLSAVHGLLEVFLELPCLTVARIPGACLGGGVEIALAADVRFAADDARIGFPEITLGCFPPAGLLLLPAAVGEARALELLLTGTAISGREAERIGLVNRSFESAVLEAETARFTQSCLSRPSEAADALRQELRRVKRDRFAGGRARVEALYSKVAQAPALAHAVGEFLDRRDRK